MPGTLTGLITLAAAAGELGVHELLILRGGARGLYGLTRLGERGPWMVDQASFTLFVTGGAAGFDAPALDNPANPGWFLDREEPTARAFPDVIEAAADSVSQERVNALAKATLNARGELPTDHFDVQVTRTPKIDAVLRQPLPPGMFRDPAKNAKADPWRSRYATWAELYLTCKLRDEARLVIGSRLRAFDGLLPQLYAGREAYQQIVAEAVEKLRTRNFVWSEYRKALIKPATETEAADERQVRIYYLFNLRQIAGDAAMKRAEQLAF